MECSPHINNCTLQESLKNQIQICQKAQDLDQSNQEQEVELNLYFKIDPYHEIEGALQLNTSVVIYAS